MKKIRIIIVVFSLFLCLLVVSCDNKEVLKVALDKEDEGRYDELFTFFTEKTGIEMKATYGQDVSKLVGTKDEPDIIKTSTVSIDSMKNSLVDLSQIIEKDKDFSTDIYIDSIIDALTIDGNIYALPTSINTSLLYYNKKLFDESSDELREAFSLSDDESVYPKEDWTWEDFKKAGIILTKYTGTGDSKVYTQFGCETQSNWWGEWLVYVRQLGGKFYKDNSNNKVCDLNSKEAIEGISFYVQKAMGDENHKFAPNAVESTAAYSFAAGNIAMIFGGHIGDWYSYDALKLDWDIQILPTPVSNNNAIGGEISADAFGISKRSKKINEAYEFLKIWSGEEGAKKMYVYNKIGALKNMEEIISSLESSCKKNINISAVFKSIEKSIPLPREKDFEKVCKERVTGELYKLLIPGSRGETDVTLILNQIKEKVDKYYQG